MNWIKTYESFLAEAIKPSVNVAEFEKLIDLPVGIGIITNVNWNANSKTLTLSLENKLNSFDVNGTHDAIDRHKGDIKKKFPGIKVIQVGSETIHLT
jgi:predicted metalloprotease with PDZ domain